MLNNKITNLKMLPKLNNFGIQINLKNNNGNEHFVFQLESKQNITIGNNNLIL